MVRRARDLLLCLRWKNPRLKKRKVMVLSLLAEEAKSQACTV